ncbi:MAG: D-alanyl-D-alanine carboxypeptidase/D-alanyl-D-alanine-endopeptidase [Burkholderiales bacterium]|nr:D-alanyl-D-alanine carboxypeptidase/D-alanyl-D-alanine-endopeptidase [Burkholderiales bacterium]
MAAAPARAADTELPRPVSEALRAAGIAQSSVALWVQPLGAAAPTLALNTDAPLNPASLVKLLTTYVALDTLGPAHRWKTQVYSVGTLEDGTLTGHLILKGSGDPKLTLEQFWLLVRNVRERGIRNLDGDLVLDRSVFEQRAHDPGAFDDEPLRPYNVGPDALLVNFKAVAFRFVPEADGTAVRVIAEPRPHPLEVVSLVRPTNGRCGDWKANIQPEFAPAAAPRTAFRALFTGRYPVSCGEKAWNIALFSHRDYVAGLFRQLWEEMGGRWQGAAHDGFVPADATPVYTHESPPLAEIVRDVNKFSNNVMARQLFLTLGANGPGAPASLASARAALEAALAVRGIDTAGLVIDNGSGLSRRSRVSARSLAQLLRTAYAGATMPEFMASLPVVAVDGTMRKYLKDDALAGQAHIKTGSLFGVRAIGGYVLARSGARQLVVMIVNDANAERARPAMDALLRWVYDPASSGANAAAPPRSPAPSRSRRRDA